MTTRARLVAGRIALYLLLILFFVICIGPLVWALSASFKNAGDIFNYPPQLISSHPTLANYPELLTTQPFIGWLITSFVVALLSSTISVLVCSLAGYAFAMFEFRGKSTLFTIMFSSLAVPFVVVALPLFILLSRIGLTNAYFVLIVPWVAPAFGIFMMRQFAEQSIPRELLESARIDGCSEVRTFFLIAFPLLRPGAGALAVWAFINSYNSFLWPLIAVSSPNQFTLPLGLQALYGAQNHQYNLVMAGAILATVPALIVFIALRKQLLEGLATGSVKG